MVVKIGQRGMPVEADLMRGGFTAASANVTMKPTITKNEITRQEELASFSFAESSGESETGRGTVSGAAGWTAEIP
jgi:hypothetical protein